MKTTSIVQKIASLTESINESTKSLTVDQINSTDGQAFLTAVKHCKQLLSEQGKRLIKKEIRELKEEGKTTVQLNGFVEDIDYVYPLTNLIRIDRGYYETE